MTKLEKLCAMRDEAVMSNLSEELKLYMYASLELAIEEEWNKLPIPA